MLTVAIPKRNKLQNIIVLTPKDGSKDHSEIIQSEQKRQRRDAAGVPAFLFLLYRENSIFCISLAGK